MERFLKILIGVAGTFVLLWTAAFVTDYIRVSAFEEPVFVIADETADDGSGVYHGLGYTVEVEKYADPEFGTVLGSVEMKMFGKVIAAAVT